jgi:putative membrane protein
MERAASRTLWLGLGLIALLLLVASSWGGGMLFGRGLAGPFGFRPFVGPWMVGMWGVGLLIRLFFFGLLGFLLFSIFRGRGAARYRSGRRDLDFDDRGQSAEDILRRRYAAGEISREQYEEMRHTLEPVS